MKRQLLAASALAALAFPASAHADEGWYVRGALGYGAPGDTDVSGALDGEIQGESDLREALAIGYEWANNFRLEGELAHRYNDTGAIGHFEDSHSKFQAWSLMLNGIYDFDTGSWWTPYVGAGLGWVESNASLAGWTTGSRPAGNTGASDPRFIQTEDSDNALAYNLIAGIAWQLGSQLTLDTEYRYFGYGETDYNPGIQVDRLGGHEAWLGLRYSFARPAAPAPVPPAPPQPAPQPEPRPQPQPQPAPPPACEDIGRVVYFEWDRSNVTDQARAVINAAINDARECGVASVEVAGHADRSGSAAYNVGLSERRARAVQDELVRLGVPASAITLEAFGESRPAVETPDGVREPLNRRAEITIDLR
ncbi:OmpA family protein [Marinicauda algicola]|uniref:OmpA family protein n=1 Tax=Marinicauda algicola TaxID=2029849 RepID=A0A4V3RYA0_9PROT|nr:OmpA family protein [Marinicauda algicola]TGY89649.1 OmpA family protein [Marinicauda algicola]